MDSLTADLILRNQNAALVEAEELIQSWLTGDDSGTSYTLCTGSHGSSEHAWAGEYPMTTSQRAVEKIHKQQFHKGHPRAQNQNSDFTTTELHHPASLGHPTSSKHTFFDPTFELDAEAMGLEGSLRREPDDYLSGLDWLDGDVGTNARTILDGLMKTSLVNTHHAKTVGEGKRSHDPRVTMEMRHREVQQRRKAKDQERSRLKQSQLAAREAQREAEIVVRREEERKRRERVREEALIQEQMATIRREMRENQQKKKVFEGKLSSLSVEHPESEAVLQCASEVVRGERREARRRETRTELVRQLQEAEATETKDRLKLLHWCFSHWYTLVVESRAKLGKATAIGDWKLQLRAWQAWRTFVSGRRARKERDRLARELQRERTYTDLAQRHHTHQLRLRCFSSWLHLVRTSQGRRKVEVEAAHHQEKMAALLQAAALGRLTTGTSVSDQSTPIGAGDDGRKDLPEKVPATKHAEVAGDHRGRREPTTVSGPPEPIIWQTARQQLDKLLLEGSKRPVVTLQDKGGEKRVHKLEQRYQHSGDKPDATAEHSLQATPEHPTSLTSEGQPTAASNRPDTGAVVTQSGDHRGSATPNLVSPAVAGVARRPKPKPATKPIPMSGMEMRSLELSQRRKVREQRKKDQELERVARLQREEEEKREAERKAKEVLAAQRREERRIARQRELEHQQRQQRLAELTSKAVRHYEHVLLRSRGLKPWRTFVELVRGQYSRAGAFHEHCLLRGAFLPWRSATVLRVREKETKADCFHREALMRRAIQTWKEQVEHTHSLEDLAVLRHPTLLLGCVFRGWCRVTREERVRTWEQERRAEKHHERYLKHHVLLAWVQFVPMSREEKVKELHRAELRRKVAAWLPDYQPRNFGQDQPEPN